MNAQLAPDTLKPLPPRIADYFPAGAVAGRKLSTREEFFDAARAIVPALRAYARKTEDIRRPADENVNAILKAGLFGISRPKAYGGAELELRDQFEVGAILAEGCPSTAWDYVVWEVHNWLVAMLPKAGQDEIFGSGDLTLACGTFNPAGAKARAVEGGYMVSGRWAFGSGSTHSNWACVVSIIDGRELNGRPEVRMMAVPRAQYEVLDTWFMRGLNGTGSHDLYIGKELFVPEHRTLATAQVNAGDTPGAKLHTAAAYRVPSRPGAHLAAAATSLGAARAAIDAFKELVTSRTHLSGVKQIDMAAPAIRLAAAEVELDAARLLFRSTALEVEERARAGTGFDMEFRAKVRMVSGHVPSVCRGIITSLVTAGGAGAMSESSPLSSLLTHVSMMAAHQSTQYDLGSENYGRVLLGLSPSNPII